VNIFAHGKAKVFNGLGIQRIHQADVDAFGSHTHREGAMEADESSGELVKDIGIRDKVVQGDAFDPQVISNYVPDFIFVADDTEVGEHFREFLPTIAHFFLNITSEVTVNKAT
jgi:hypothetical protein